MKRSITLLLSIFFLAGTALAVPPPAPVPDYTIIPGTYSWIDIENPANDTGINCDDCGVVEAIGFNFNHYGNIYSSVGISSNGYLTFGGDLSDWTNDDIPNSTDPNDYIAPFWDDLRVYGSAGGKIYAATIGSSPNRKFVVTYYDVDWCCTQNNGNLTFQVILSEADGSITFQYKDMLSVDAIRGSGGSATIGIENASGTAGLQYSYNAPSSVSDGQAIAIVQDADTDGDGLPDSWEILYGTDHTDPDDPVLTEDVDNDGLNWIEEYNYKTHPFDEDTDKDGVTDGEEVSNGTNPAVNSGPVTLIAAGPGAEFGTVYFDFSVGPWDPTTTGFRVYYGASSGTSIDDYDASLDINNPSDRSGFIDQQWGMNGVPIVFFRIAAVKTISGSKYVGTLSNELSTYFAGMKDDPAEDPDQSDDQIQELEKLNNQDTEDDNVCFISSASSNLSFKQTVSRIKRFLGKN